MKKKLENGHSLLASIHPLPQSIPPHFSVSHHTCSIYSHHALSTVPTAPLAYHATTTAYLLTLRPLLLLYCSRTCLVNTFSPYAPQLPSVTSPQPSSATNKISSVYMRSTTNSSMSSLLPIFAYTSLLAISNANYTPHY